MRPTIVVHDEDWQFPAITEKYAYECAKKYLPPVNGVVYFAFPWATLIDKLQNRSAGYKELKAALLSYADLLRNAAEVVTVCQHIRMLHYESLFLEMGVTTVFWTHATKGVENFQKSTSIKIKPFPLYPVQAAGVECIEESTKRKYLFSFVGARSNQWYLTQSRNFILDSLGGVSGSLVVGRDAWHFNKIVYDHQIKNKVGADVELVDKAAEEDFQRIMADSLFSLCPSGSGPNTIRLWEAFGTGSIPVVLADTYCPPGLKTLWESATVTCPETLEDIQALPDRLKEIAADEEKVRAMLFAGKQIWSLYGLDRFVYDIELHYVEIAENSRKLGCEGADSLSYEFVQMLARDLISGSIKDPLGEKIFVSACCTRALIDRDNFLKESRARPEIRHVCELLKSNYESLNFFDVKGGVVSSPQVVVK
jgi:hypothetical protein